MRGVIGCALVLALASPAEASGLQARCERLLGARTGAIVALDPASGRLLALVHPELARTPLPPGSVFKLVTGLAAIEAGVARPGSTFDCRGVFHPPGSAASRPCWRPGGHGRLELEEAIARSCNVWFYQAAEAAGAGAVSRTSARLGLGAAPGWLRPPTDPAGRADFGIGEGKGVAVTALQLAAGVGAIANGGILRTPAWTPSSTESPPIASAGALARLRAGMRAAVVGGSARSAAVPGLAVAGKTGTATYLDGSHRTYGWFVGYAPAEAPRVVVVVLLPQATGFSGAAPLGGRVLGAWAAGREP